MLNPKEVIDTLNSDELQEVYNLGNRYFGPAIEKYIWEAIDVAYFLGFVNCFLHCSARRLFLIRQLTLQVLDPLVQGVELLVDLVYYSLHFCLC